MLRRIEARIVNDLLGKDIPLPSYATEGSAAMDLRACISAPITIPPGGRELIKTGLAINMMDPGLVAIVASRSGLSLKHHVHVAQGIGVWLAVQAFINMGVNMGLLPTKGLTLPLLSFGGTGIVVNCMALAILLRIDFENRYLMRGAKA